MTGSHYFVLTMDDHPDTVVNLNLDDIADINLDQLPLNDTVILTYKNGIVVEVFNHRPFFYEWEVFIEALESLAQLKEQEKTP